MPKIDTLPLLSVAEVADLADLSVQAVRKAISAESLPAKRIGRDHVLHRADVDAWMAKPRPKGRPPKKTG